MTALSLLRSLPLRATAAAAVVLLVAATALVAAIGWQANRALSDRTLATLDAEIIDLAALHRRGGLAALLARIDELAARRGPDLYAVDLADGRRVAGTLLLPPAAALHAGVVFNYRGTAAATERLAVARLVQVQSAGTEGGTATLVVARDIEDQRVLARRIQATALAGLAVLSLLALGLGLAARRALLGRIGAITDASTTIMRGDLAGRIRRDGSGDEIDALAGNLNAMLARIESLMQALRDVSDNIAHDLRTPLNRLRNAAEEAQRMADGDQRQRLGRIIEEADGLIGTFNALLMIARLEPGMNAEEMSDVDVARLVADVAELYQPVAEDAGLELVVHTEPPVVLTGNRQLLGQAVANLLDNAIKYGVAVPAHAEAGGARSAGPPIAAGRVDVTVKAEVDAVHLIVADQGPGIPAIDRARVLDRFVRLEMSRSKPGTGLGLSLVAAIARLHDGRLRLDGNAPRGLVVTLSLPRRPVVSSV